jgi:hypothetical protein
MKRRFAHVARPRAETKRSNWFSCDSTVVPIRVGAVDEEEHPALWTKPIDLHSSDDGQIEVVAEFMDVVGTVT